MAGVFSKLHPNFHNVLRSSQVLSNGPAYRASGSCNKVSGSSQKVTHIADTNRNDILRTDSAYTTNRERSGRMNNVSESSNRNQFDNVGTTSDRRNIHRDHTDSVNTNRETGNLNRNQTDSVDTRRDITSSTGHQADVVDSRNAESDRDRISTKDDAEESKQSFGNSFGIVLNNLKYRQYATQDSRLKSYGKWPKNKKVNVNTLINAGFAYTGVDDSVRCFYCGGALRDWPDDADPWREHALKFPDCGHLRQCKGDAYIKHVRGEDDSDCEIDGDGNGIIDRVEVAIKRNEDAVMAARDFCNDENLLRCGIKRLLLKNDTFSGVDLIKETEKIKEDDESTKIVEAASFEKECSESESESENELDILEENRKLKDPVTCKICFDAIACIITLPCGHMISCSQCISALSKCAVCRAEIKGTVRALMAV